MHKKILLINPNQNNIYAKVKIKPGAIYSPVLSLAALGASCLKEGHAVKIFDANLPVNNFQRLQKLLKSFLPDYVGITFTTPLFPQMVKIAIRVREYSPKSIVVVGGAHASSFPEETLKDAPVDIVVIGEGDFTLPEILSGKQLKDIKGIAYHKKFTLPRPPLANLDLLPFPAWQLYDLNKYQTSSLLTRANPAGWLETSRGCIYGCVYCNKSVFGRTFRVKSAKRVVAEIEHMLKVGFKEIHLADDCFTTDMKRAEEICDLIIQKNLHFPWATVTGIRVDRVTLPLLKKMKQAGCYRVFYGIESGSQKILNNIHKGTNLTQIKNAVKWSKEAGLETFGFFMIALPGETISDIQKTIQFATSLDLDVAKMSVTTPLPATPLFDELQKNGRIKTTDWSKYNLYQPTSEIYDHPTLDWKTVDKYYSLFYRSFYLNPRFLFKRFLSALHHKTFISDLRAAFQIKW